MFDLWAVAVSELVSILSQWGESGRYPITVCLQVAVPGATSNECPASIEDEGCLENNVWLVT